MPEGTETNNDPGQGGGVPLIRVGPLVEPACRPDAVVHPAFLEDVLLQQRRSVTMRVRFHAL